MVLLVVIYQRGNYFNDNLRGILVGFLFVVNLGKLKDGFLFLYK